MEKLAELLRAKNRIDDEIASLIGRPALIGHTGEYVAAAIFDIELNSSATQEGTDGYFRSGALKSKSVNVKWYPKKEGILDINSKTHYADYYLVLTGPKSAPASSRGKSRPWIVESVYLFDMHKIIDDLLSRSVKIGVGTSILQQAWIDSEIYPRENHRFVLSEQQKNLISLFKSRN